MKIYKKITLTQDEVFDLLEVLTQAKYDVVCDKDKCGHLIKKVLTGVEYIFEEESEE